MLPELLLSQNFAKKKDMQKVIEIFNNDSAITKVNSLIRVQI